MNKIKELDEEITLHVLKSEQLGNDCRIDEAQQVLNECDEMREEKKKLETVRCNDSFSFKTYFEEKLSLAISRGTSEFRYE